MRLRDPHPPQASPLSRRDFLRIAGLAYAGTAVLLGGCGDGNGVGRGSSGPEIDARLLNRALGLEYTAVAAYSTALPLLSGTARANGRNFLEHEREHAARLRRAIRDVGGVPNDPRTDDEYARSFPRLRSQRDALRFATDLEYLKIARYLKAIPHVSEPELRRTAASINAAEAEHVVALGLRPTPDSFVTGTIA